MPTYLEITGMDPIVARDGRPFGDGTGNRMRGLTWPLPSAVAGSARRAFVVNDPAGGFDHATLDNLVMIEVAGLFPVHNDQLYLPAPKNCLRDEDNDEVHRVFPVEFIDGSGCDLPHGLQLVTLGVHQAKDDFKPKPIPAWWPVDKLAEWLTGGESSRNGCEFFGSGCFFESAHTSYRERLAIEPSTGAAEESKLFTVSDLTISHLITFLLHAVRKSKAKSVALSVRVSESELTRSLNLLHPLGGNRRLAHWKTAPNDLSAKLWNCPETVRHKLSKSNRVCLLLTTPALFAGGWKPGWLNEWLVGSPPGSQVSLKCVAVINDRWKALSRWSLDPRTRGPKPIRRMVPAGSVYFFTVEKPGDAAPLADLWLQSVSDDEQERRDGFGLAVWGTWDSNQETS